MMETTSLKKEGMSIYGHCPAHDDFFLVACIHCGQLVKPQAFERHCESRHGPFSKLYDLSTNFSPDWPQPGEPPSQHGSLCEGKDRRHQDVGPPGVPPPCSPHQGSSIPQREVHRSMTPSDSAVEMEQKVMCSEELQVESFLAGFSSEKNDDENCK